MNVIDGIYVTFSLMCEVTPENTCMHLKATPCIYLTSEKMLLENIMQIP